MINELEPFEEGRTRLYGLGPIANIDKHDDLIAAGSAGAVTEMRGVYMRRVKTTLLTLPNTGRLDHGIVIANLGPNGVVNFPAKTKVRFALAVT